MAGEQQAAAPVPGTPEYDAAMAAKFDAAQDAAAKLGAPQAPAAEAAQRPEHIPEKFWDAATGQVRLDELAKSYTELERKQAEPPKAPAATEQTPPAPQTDEQKAAAEALAQKGLNMADFSTEFAEKGELSLASYTTLEKAGIPRDMVDRFIEGEQLRADRRDSTLMQEAGGNEKWATMSAWSEKNLTPGERQVFNETVSKGSMDAAKLAMAGLRQRFEAANGRDPALLGGDRGGPAAGYRSQAEMTAAIRDPRYKIDPAYRADVTAKIGAADFWK